MANAVSSLDGNRLAGIFADICHQLQHGSKTLDELALFAQGKDPFQKSVQSGNTLTVVPSTIEQMIADGKYNSVNEKFVKMFSFNPVTIGDWEFRLIDPEGHISSVKAQKLCEESGWQSGEIEHMLALGVAFPNLQRINPVTALGSGCPLGGDRRVPELWVDDGGRKLDWRWWFIDWDRRYRFLSVRKV